MRRLSLKVTRRADGRVCKRINGTLHIWANEALARKDLLARIAATETDPNAAIAAIAEPSNSVAVIKDVFNSFLADREARMLSGRIKQGTFLDYKDALESFIAAIEQWRPANPDAVSLFGRRTPVDALRPEHFRHVRATQSTKVGSYALERRVQGIRTAFRWACEIERSIARLPYYGDDYHKPSKSEKRADRRSAETTGGERRFSIDEIKAILTYKDLKPALKAMIWLALNSGMYSADCAVLRWSDVKKEGKLWFIDTYREKTGIRQKVVLWNETVEALQAWKVKRPKPRGNAPKDLIFVTAHGNPWIAEHLTRDAEGRVKGGGETNSIKLLFDRLLKHLEIKRKGIGFGKFRHTHTSAAGSHPDVNARKATRGHKIDGIEEAYDTLDLKRLKSVSDLVYSVLIRPALKNTVSRGAKKVAQPLSSA